METGPQGAQLGSVITYSNYSFKRNVPMKQNKYGQLVNLMPAAEKLCPVSCQFVNSLSYYVTFKHPTRLNGRQTVEAENFFPLLRDVDDDIVSYAEFSRSATFVFPQIPTRKPISLSHC